MSVLEWKTRILPGGRIEIPATGLPEGCQVKVQIVLEEETPPLKRSFKENLGDYKGGQLFRSAEEVDRYIQEERNSWGD